MSGIKGLQGVVRKTVNDELQANIWEPQHMDKIVPSLLFNLQHVEEAERSGGGGGGGLDPGIEGCREPGAAWKLQLQKVQDQGSWLWEWGAQGCCLPGAWAWVWACTHSPCSL